MSRTQAALVASAAFFAVPVAAQHEATRTLEPYVSDAAICNEQAYTKTAMPGAAPGTAVPPRRDPESLRPAAPLTPKPGITLDRSGSIVTNSTDPWLEGMARLGLWDDAYRAAYRECIEERLRRRR